MQFEEIVAEERRKNSAEIARKMLQDKVDENIVAKYTGLSIEEVHDISQST